MNKIGEFVDSIKGFVTDVRVELKKCAWPSKPELVESTVVVIVSCVILAVFVGFSDTGLMWLMGLVIR
ncbi:MAG: preprotein translocase subunit SecE [Verrucomicrobia bacterium]|nr:preprotein translocase subunit SecE [Verrucomicrobiota bacterium]